VYACITTPTEVAVLVEPAGDVAAVNSGATMIMELLGIDRTLRVMGGGPLAVPRSSFARKVPVAVGVGGLVAAALAGTVAALAGGLFGSAPPPTRVPVVPFPTAPTPLAAAPSRPRPHQVAPTGPRLSAAPAVKVTPVPSASFGRRVPAVVASAAPGLVVTSPAIIDTQAVVTNPAIVAGPAGVTSPAVTAEASVAAPGGSAPNKPAAAAIKTAAANSASSFSAASGAGKGKDDRRGVNGDDRPHGKGHQTRRREEA